MGIRWANYGDRPIVADERDLDEQGFPDAPEVERICRGIRKGLEDRGARVDAHSWYFSEMEVGRNHASRLLTRLARHFYKLTSNYGLSALRPAVVLAFAIATAFLAFSVPNELLCPVTESAVGHFPACVGWADRIEVVMLAIFLQAPPDGVSLAGPVSVLLWLLLRVTGAAMLVLLAVAFRNQVAR